MFSQGLRRLIVSVAKDMRKSRYAARIFLYVPVTRYRKKSARRPGHDVALSLTTFTFGGALNNRDDQERRAGSA